MFAICHSTNFNKIAVSLIKAAGSHISQNYLIISAKFHAFQGCHYRLASFRQPKTSHTSSTWRPKAAFAEFAERARDILLRY
jgi:hypothetical protein